MNYLQSQAEKRLKVAQHVAPHAYHTLGKSKLGMLTILNDSEPAIAFSTGFTKQGKYLPLDVFARVYAFKLRQAMEGQPT